MHFPDSPGHNDLWLAVLQLRLSVSTIAQALLKQCTDLGLHKFLKCLRIAVIENRADCFLPYFFVRSQMVFVVPIFLLFFFFSHLISRFIKSHRLTDRWGPPSPRGGRSPDNRDYSTGTQCLSKEHAQIHLYVGIDTATVRSKCKLWQIGTTITGCQKEQWWRCAVIRKENECSKQNNQNPCVNQVINGQVIAEKCFLLC